VDVLSDGLLTFATGSLGLEGLDRVHGRLDGKATLMFDFAAGSFISTIGALIALDWLEDRWSSGGGP
jgi:hypothetical protein